MDLPLCDTEKEFRQLYPLPNTARRDDGQSACDCPLICSTITYKMHVDSRTTDQADTASLLIRPLVQQTSVTIERCAYTFNALVCDVGATLGFFLGISLLAVFELGEYCIMLCAANLDVRRKKSERGKQPHHARRKMDGATTRVSSYPILAVVSGNRKLIKK